jgi:hypothetical protein
MNVENLVIVSGSCPAGGDHQGGTSGEWIGKCVKCGNPC